MLRNWDEIKAALGEKFWDKVVLHRLPREDADRRRFELWDAFCAFADEYPSPREEALSYLSERRERAATPNVLRFLARTRPGGGLLLEYCLGTLSGSGHEYHTSNENAGAVAAELLGVHFANDPKVLERLARHLLEERYTPFVREAALIALCEGWPESEELREAFRVVREHQQRLSYPAYFQLVSLKYDSSDLLKDMGDKLLAEPELEDRSGSDPRRVVRPILRRLRADDGFSVLMEERLRGTPTASEKATLPRLIASARGVTPDLRAWCVAEVDAQTRSVSPEVGFDLSAGALRPVVHSLLSVLDVRPDKP